MTKLTKEDGITLIEVLAAVTILSIVIVTVSSVFFGGIDYSNKANETISMQQEANLMVTSITKLHESGYNYTIMMDQNPSATAITLSGKDQAGTSRSFQYSNDHFEYSLYDYSSGSDTLINKNTLVSTTRPLYIKIVIKNKKHPSETYEVKTIINRL